MRGFTKKRASIFVVVHVLLAFSISSFGADYYVTPGGAGVKDGSDWSNAFEGKPSFFEKGSTYYIAGGDYTNDGTGIGFRWDIPNLSGTGTITIVKATQGNSGNILGYQDSFGKDQAIFATSGACSTSFFSSWGAFALDTDDIIIDGSYKDGIKIIEGPADWKPFSSTGYFKVAVLVKNASNILLKNMLFQFADDPVGEENPYIKIGIYDWLNEPENLRVEKCNFSKPNIAVRGSGRDSYFIDGCTFSESTSAYSGFPGWPFNALLSIGYSSSGLVARNTFSGDIGTTRISLVESGKRYDIHGNLVVNCNGYRSAFAAGGNSRFINNTIATSSFGNSDESGVISFPMQTDGNVVDNNLFMNVTLDSETLVRGPYSGDYNWCFDGSDNSTNECAQVAAATNGIAYLFGEEVPDIFQGISTDDFRLKEELAGKTLSSGSFALNIDRLGAKRGGDGIWDRGAFEFVGRLPFNIAIFSILLLSTQN